MTQLIKFLNMRQTLVKRNNLEGLVFTKMLYLIKNVATKRLTPLSLTKIIKIKQVALCPGSQPLVS